MANVALVFSFQIKDADGDPKDLVIYAEVDDATTLAGLQTWITGTAPVVDAITDGKTAKASTAVEFTLPAGLKANAVAGSDVQEGGNLNWALAGTNRTFGMFVPAIKESLKTGNTVNIADALITALVTRITTSNNGVVAANQFGKLLTTINKGEKKFRK